MSHRGERLTLSEVELSRAEIHTGVESLKYGLIDAIGTTTDAREKAAGLAGLRNYGVIDINEELGVQQPIYWPLSLSSMVEPGARTGMMPSYYYLFFESE